MHIILNLFYFFFVDIIYNLIIFCRKVYLGHKKNNLEQMYAIKVMKKTDMINKNMITQGNFFLIQLILLN